MKNIETLCIRCNKEPQMKVRRICRHCLNIQNRQCKSHSYEYSRQYQIEYYAKNKERISLRMKQEYQENVLKHILKGINKRSKKFGHKLLDMVDLEKLVQSSSKCEDCGTEENLSVGHRIPLFYPVSNNSYKNLIRQCFHCNTHLQGFLVHISAYTEELAKYYRFYTPNSYIKNSLT